MFFFFYNGSHRKLPVLTHSFPTRRTSELDVIHNFAMPQFGLKTDAVPERINETWAYVPAEFAGQTFYGQCSELCVTGHAYMPIMVKERKSTRLNSSH